MTTLPITLVTTAALGVIFVGLSLAVSVARARSHVGLGSGPESSVEFGQEQTASRLLVAIRNHGHFAEYVPISLILLGLLELAGADRPVLLGLAGALVVSRLMVPLGMGRPAPNPFRAGGTLLQWLMIVAASTYGAWLVLGR